jgi:hypothetical protein
VNFDSTRGVFDPLVVQEYVSWTGQKGGALVTTSNVTTQSDLRLYESDNNVTMNSLLAQGAGFLDTCVTLLERTINTVPARVSLGSQITSMAVKPVNVTYDFGPSNKLQLSGSIRVSVHDALVISRTLTITCRYSHPPALHHPPCSPFKSVPTSTISHLPQQPEARSSAPAAAHTVPRRTFRSR